jgi:hypothetical protein
MILSMSAADGEKGSVYQDILDSGRPLLIARVAVDDSYEQQRQEVEAQFATGADLQHLMQQPHHEETTGIARQILGTEAPDDGAWSAWYQLKATVDVARPQRVFTAAAFSDLGAIDVRRQLRKVAFTGYASLLVDAFDRLSPKHDTKRNSLRQAISQLTVLAALNYGELSDMTAQVAPGAVTFRTRAEGEFTLMHSSHAQSNLLSISAYRVAKSKKTAQQPTPQPSENKPVATVADTPLEQHVRRAAIMASGESYPTPVRVIVSRDFATQDNELRMSTLVRKAHEGGLKEFEARELASSVKALRKIIILRAGNRS